MKLPIAFLLALSASPALAQSSLPDPRLTPGALNPDVTQATIQTTICVRGWTRTVRPPEEYTRRLKRVSIAQYGYADHRLSSYEEDHLISLSLGGHPTAPENLWAEPLVAADGWRAADKDALEAVLPRLVCQGRVSLAAAQAAIASDWETAFTQFVVNGE